MKYLGIDYGTKRIGLAFGDAETKTAVVFGTVKNIDEIISVINKEEVDAVVVGKPYSIVNVAHDLPENFRTFINELTSKLPEKVKIIFEDERLSSKYADSLFGGKKDKASRDEIAAVSILQGYLDKIVNI